MSTSICRVSWFLVNQTYNVATKTSASVGGELTSIWHIRGPLASAAWSANSECNMRVRFEARLFAKQKCFFTTQQGIKVIKSEWLMIFVDYHFKDLIRAMETIQNVENDVINTDR